MLAGAEGRIEYWADVERSGIQAFDRHATHLFYDLEGYLREIGTPQENEALAEILRQSVVYKASTESFLLSGAGGFGSRNIAG